MFSICQPVVDLRKTPQWITAQDFSHQDARDSQLLYGEPVRLIRKEGPWCSIQALLQGCYPGWVHESELISPATPYQPNVVICQPHTVLEKTALSLCYGTLLEGNSHGEVKLLDGSIDYVDPACLRPLSLTLDMTQLCYDAHLFLHAPYLWGGCSSPSPNRIQSVDCSGLIHLLYRAQSLILPRDAKDQAKVGRLVKKLQPGDAIYLAKPQKQAHHVLLVLNEETCIEAPSTGGKVRLVKRLQTFNIHGDLIEIEGREPCPYTVKRFCNLPLNLSKAFV